MRRLGQIFKRLLIIVLAAVCFQTALHTMACHSGHDADEQGCCSQERACSCIYHTAIESADDSAVCVESLGPAWKTAFNETVCLPLLSSDIFRPPLTRG